MSEPEPEDLPAYKNPLDDFTPDDDPTNTPIHDEGYNRDLSKRHMAMIAIGGAIGTGLFLGAGVRLRQVGPSLILIYALCGLCAFMVLRAIGHLVMYRPSSGSFVTYAREFLGEGAAYAAGWFFFMNWALCGIADISAVALFMRYWDIFGGIPQWMIALAALAIVAAANFIGVRWFGEIEFWLSIVKVTAIVLFLAAGIGVLAWGVHLHGYAPGLHLISENGGFFPHGMLAPLLLIQGVIFAYAATELIGVAAGESDDPRKIVPKAINGVIWRIALFYVGSITLLALVLPWTAYKAGESPFVTFFGALGVPGMASIMNLVVVTAALSSLNSGLYSTGRVLRALSLGGSAPKALSRMNRQRVPYVGIGATLAIYLLGVALNYFIPANVFELALSISSVGVLAAWATIILCQLGLYRAIQAGRIAPTGFPMPFAPYSSYLTLAFLAAVLVLMAFDYPNGTLTVACLPFLGLAFAGGWRLIRRSRNRRGLSPYQDPNAHNAAGFDR